MRKRGYRGVFIGVIFAVLLISVFALMGFVSAAIVIPPSGGACCWGGGNLACAIASATNCTSIYMGTYKGDGTTCSPNPCVSGPVCGNNMTESGEVCDGNVQACTSSMGPGFQPCNSQCTGWNTCVPYIQMPWTIPSSAVNNSKFSVSTNVYCWKQGGCGDVTVTLDPTPIPDSVESSDGGFWAWLKSLFTGKKSVTGNIAVGPVCGNGVCEIGETKASCPGDCNICSMDWWTCGSELKCSLGGCQYTSDPALCAVSMDGMNNVRCQWNSAWNMCFPAGDMCSGGPSNLPPCPGRYFGGNDGQDNGGISGMCSLFSYMGATGCNAVYGVFTLTKCAWNGASCVPDGSCSGGGGPVCGNSACESGETCSSCPADCGSCAVCGNGACESGETATNCPRDCPKGAVPMNSGSPFYTTSPNPIDKNVQSCLGNMAYGSTCFVAWIVNATGTIGKSYEFYIIATSSVVGTDYGPRSNVTITAAVCGNGAVEPGEQCDGSNLNGQTCIGLGFSGGTLACSGSCTFNTAGCTSQTCGNGIREGTEQCDDGSSQTPISCGIGGCQRTISDNCVGCMNVSCTPGSPTTETCNNIDDDCDGSTDETFTNKGQPCTMGVGACMYNSFYTCKADGTGTACEALSGAPKLAADIWAGSGGSQPYNYAAYNGKLYFMAYTPAVGNEIFVYDPATGVASLLNDLYPGSSGSYPGYLYVFNNKLYFYANAGGGLGSELYSYDSTTNTVSLVKDVCPGSCSGYPQAFVAYNGKLYFTADDGGGAGSEMHSYDPATNVVSLVTDSIYPGSSNGGFGGGAVYNGKLYFQAYGASVARELYSYDSTTNTVSLVADLCPGTCGSMAAGGPVYNGKMYFGANNGATGSELYSYDSTTNTISLAADIYPGSTSSYLGNLAVYNGKLYFSADGGTVGTELYSYDSTTSTVSLVKDINPGSSGSYPSYITVYNNKLYFEANNGTSGNELFFYDSVTNKLSLFDIIPGIYPSGASYLVVASGKLYFTATNGTSGSELFVYSDVPLPIPEICGNGIDDDCNGVVDNGCQVCGNGVIEGTEVCDGTALGGQTCVTQGFTGGTLACNADCMSLNTAGCYHQETLCADGLDNDNDGKIDCDDPDCQATANCVCFKAVDESGTQITSFSTLDASLMASYKLNWQYSGWLGFTDATPIVCAATHGLTTVQVGGIARVPNGYPALMNALGAAQTIVPGTPVNIVFSKVTANVADQNGDVTFGGALKTLQSKVYLEITAVGGNPTSVYMLNDEEFGYLPVGVNYGYRTVVRSHAATPDWSYPLFGDYMSKAATTERLNALFQRLTVSVLNAAPTCDVSTGTTAYITNSAGETTPVYWGLNNNDQVLVALSGSKIYYRIRYPGSPWNGAQLGPRTITAADTALIVSPDDINGDKISDCEVPPCTVTPNACDGVDNDCDGSTDEADEYTPVATTCGLGICKSTGMTSCVAGSVVDSCVPGPAGVESCNPDVNNNNNIDENCDGSDLDCGFSCDRDNDGHRDASRFYCFGDDCDDNDANTYPGAMEIPDGKDNDCDTLVDEMTVKVIDSFGNPLPNTRVDYGGVGGFSFFGTTGVDGTTQKVLPLITYSFYATYGPTSSQVVQQNLANNLFLQFQTARVIGEIVDSTGAPLSGGYVRYARNTQSGWATMDTTTDANGRVYQEMFPGTWVFYADYAGTSSTVQTKAVVEGSVVRFQTSKTGVDLKSCSGVPKSGVRFDYGSPNGGFSYYGTTNANGQAFKELFPVSTYLNAYLTPSQLRQHDFRVNLMAYFTDPAVCCTDVDGDGYGAPGSQGCTYTGDDCDDNNPNVHPGATELCNGIDDDCNSGTADGSGESWYNDPTVCGDGICASTGNLVCVNGQQKDTCTPGTPLPAEICDGVNDDDCDGLVDNGCACTNGKTRPCGSDVGECVKGTETCTNGQWNNICAGEVTPTTEVCDGLDNDCDNVIDGVFGTTTCGQGVCLHTIENCLNGQTQTCNPLEGSSPEVCEGSLDEDCDGTVDNGCECTNGQTRPCGSDVGECVKGTQTCVAGQWAESCVGEVLPVPETCDGLDNDCDGVVDNGFVSSEIGAVFPLSLVDKLSKKIDNWGVEKKKIYFNNVGTVSNRMLHDGAFSPELIKFKYDAKKLELSSKEDLSAYMDSIMTACYPGYTKTTSSSGSKDYYKVDKTKVGELKSPSDSAAAAVPEKDIDYEGTLSTTAAGYLSQIDAALDGYTTDARARLDITRDTTGLKSVKENWTQGMSATQLTLWNKLAAQVYADIASGTRVTISVSYEAKSPYWKAKVDVNDCITASSLVEGNTVALSTNAISAVFPLNLMKKVEKKIDKWGYEKKKVEFINGGDVANRLYSTLTSNYLDVTKLKFDDKYNDYKKGSSEDTNDKDDYYKLEFESLVDPTAFVESQLATCFSGYAKTTRTSGTDYYMGSTSGSKKIGKIRKPSTGVVVKTAETEGTISSTSQGYINTISGLLTGASAVKMTLEVKRDSAGNVFVYKEEVKGASSKMLTSWTALKAQIIKDLKLETTEQKVVVEVNYEPPKQRWKVKLNINDCMVQKLSLEEGAQNICILG